MKTLKAELQKYLLTFKNKTKNIRNKQPIWIDLQTQNDLVLLNQQNHSLRGTSNLSNKNINSNALQNHKSPQTLQKGGYKQEKNLVFEKVQFIDLACPAIRNPHFSITNIEKEQKIVENQENLDVMPPQLSFLCQPSCAELKRKLIGQLDNSKNKKNQLNFYVSNLNDKSYIDVGSKQESVNSFQSNQNLEPSKKKENQITHIQDLKRVTRSFSRKQKNLSQISSQYSTTSQLPSMELLEVGSYRLKILEVAKKIYNVFQEVKRDPTFFMSTDRQSRAVVSQSPKCLIGSRQYEQVKKNCLRKMEKRRFIYLD